MMAGAHAASGALAGVAVAGLAGGGPAGLATGAAAGAGAALLPDLDHPSATASRCQGAVTGTACRGVRALSALAWRATATRYDRGGYDRDGTHRHLSHTVVAALTAGLAAGVAALHWAGAAAVLWLLFSLGARGAGAGRWIGGRRGATAAWVSVSLGAGAATAAVVLLSPPSPALLAALVSVGMVVHCLGDGLTTAGVPLAWPMRLGGQRWRMLGAPRRLRFNVGSRWQEVTVQWLCWCGTPVLGAVVLS